MTQKTTAQTLAWLGLQVALVCAGFFFFAVIACTVIGAYYPKTLVGLHLEWLSVPLRGIYTDCSAPENRNAVYCQPKETGYDMHKAGIREKQKPPPFTLYSSPG